MLKIQDSNTTYESKNKTITSQIVVANLTPKLRKLNNVKQIGFLI